MSFFKDMADKLLQKKEALEAEARKKATEKATEIAIEQGKQAARSAVSRASKALEDALFGDDDKTAKDSDAPDSEAPAKKPARAARAAPGPQATPPEDPQLAAKRRADAQARIEAEVDDELAALKRKLKK